MENFSHNIQFRTAQKEDLPVIVQMLSDDPLGQEREQYGTPLPEEYVLAFDAIENDSNNTLVLACSKGKIIGFYQITFIPYLTYKGKWRALVEGVRVHTSCRHQGVGKALILKAIEQAKQKGCHLIQLTTDKKRSGALAFYESLGFIASHEGMKLHFS